MHTTESYEVAYGVVNWFDIEQGFGFVTPVDGNHDVFVDFSEIVDATASELQSGRRVSYRAGGTRRWPTAESLHVL